MLAHLFPCTPLSAGGGGASGFADRLTNIRFVFLQLRTIGLRNVVILTRPSMHRALGIHLSLLLWKHSSGSYRIPISIDRLLTRDLPSGSISCMIHSDWLPDRTCNCQSKIKA